MTPGAFSERFEFEAERFAGSQFLGSNHWEMRLFGPVSEAVEHTALQRGVERYWSEKRHDEECGFEEVRIQFHPLNPVFDPIVVTSAEEEALGVLGR